MRGSLPVQSRILLPLQVLLAALAAPAMLAQSSIAEKRPVPVEQHFDAAETFQLTGDLEKAAAEYRVGISVALQRLANLKLADGDTAGSIELLRRSVAADPKNVDAAIDLGIALFHNGSYAAAKDSVLAALKTDPANFRGRNLLGKIYFMQGEFASAAGELQAALAIQQDFDVAYTLALANLELKKLPQATVLFDEMRASGRKTPELHVLLGQAYRQTGYLDLAVQEFKSALELDAHYPHAHGYLGMTYVALGGDTNYDLATKEFRLELSNTPADYSSHYFLGLIALERHDLVAAEAALHEARRAHPDDPGTLLLFGRLYVEQKKWTDAVATLRNYLEPSTSAPMPPSQIALAHELLSKAYVGSGKTADGAAEAAIAQDLRNTNARSHGQEAGSPTSAPETQELRSMLIEAPLKKPADASETRYVSLLSKLLGNAYHNLGVMAARNGNYLSAAEEFKQAASWDHSIPQLDHNWGLAAFRAQSYSDAIVPLKRSLEREPRDPNVRQMLGLCYYMTNDFKASAETFRPIVTELPNNPGLLLSAGIAFVKSGDALTGERLFTRAFVTGSGTPEVHLMIGQAYAEQAHYPQALAEFRRALELNPNLPEAHYFSGMVLFKKGDIEDAAREFEHELEVDAKHVPSMYQIAYIRLEQHQAPEAVRLLEEVIKRQPDYADAHYELGKALLEQEDVNGATRELERSVQLHPTDYAYFQLSRAYTRAGRSDDAKKAEQKFEQLKPKPPATPASNN